MDDTTTPPYFVEGVEQPRDWIFILRAAGVGVGVGVGVARFPDGDSSRRRRRGSASDSTFIFTFLQFYFVRFFSLVNAVKFKACFFFQTSQKASVRDENRL